MKRNVNQQEAEPINLRETCQTNNHFQKASAKIF